MSDIEFGENIDWKALPSPESYYPTRLEYFAGKALEGLLVGKAHKDVDTCVVKAIQLATVMELKLDELNSKKD